MTNEEATYDATCSPKGTAKFKRCAISLALLLFFCSVASAQIELSYEIRKSLVGATNPEILPGGRILIDADSKTSVSDLAVIKVASSEGVRLLVQKDGKDFVGLQAYKSNVDPDSKITTSMYLLIGEGSYNVYGLSRVNETWDRKMPVLIGPPQPPPKPDDPVVPVPVVPPDQFDNIGQRVAKMSVGLPKAREVGAIYLKYAVELESNQAMDVTKAISSASAERLTLLGGDAPKYNDVTAMLNTDLQGRWKTMSKGLLAEWMRCIAIGYGAKP